MGIAAWSYGTGATTSAAHPFSLAIQGIDVIDAVPRETIRLTSSIASNGTLEFAIEDIANTQPIPTAYADVLFTEHAVAKAFTAFEPTAFEPTAFQTSLATTGVDEIIFSGLVIGVEVSALAMGRMISIRCVDYGLLLDKIGMTADFTALEAGPSYPQTAAALAPIGPITSGAQAGGTWLATNDARVMLPQYGFVYGLESLEGDVYAAWTPLRGVLEEIAAHNIASQLAPNPVTGDFFIFVDPEQRLNWWNENVTYGNVHLGSAPRKIVESTSPAADEMTAADLTITYDHTGLESFVRGADSDAATGGDNSRYLSDTAASGGLQIGTASLTRFMSDDNESYWACRGYLDSRSTVARGTFTVIGTVNFRIGQVATITSAALGLSADTFLIHAVSTDFLGGSVRRCRVEFGGIRASASRATRTLIARASA